MGRGCFHIHRLALVNGIECQAAQVDQRHGSVTGALMHLLEIAKTLEAGRQLDHIRHENQQEDRRRDGEDALSPFSGRALDRIPGELDDCLESIIDACWDILTTAREPPGLRCQPNQHHIRDQGSHNGIGDLEAADGQASRLAGQHHHRADRLQNRWANEGRIDPCRDQGKDQPALHRHSLFNSCFTHYHPPHSVVEPALPPGKRAVSGS